MSSDRLDLGRATGGNAALFGQLSLFDGTSGRGLSFADLASRAARADVTMFGEEHYNGVCCGIEAQLLASLANRRRPVALAMEFFERDTQPTIDAYLANRLDEPAMVKQARQGDKYVLSHRPLIEMCRAARLPVVAANTPRRLLRELRTSGMTYDAFRASRSSADQAFLPLECRDMDGPYFERYLEAMKDHPPAPATRPAAGRTSMSSESPAPTLPHTHMQKSADAHAGSADHPMKKFFRLQLLWDDTMAESVATFRGTYPDHRVLLIVGSFHIAYDGGTLVKYRERRPGDRVCTVVFRACKELPKQLADKDRGAADIVVYGCSPAQP